MLAEIYLKLLNLLHENPSWTQRQLSDALNISLGKTNYCLKASKDKGWLKWGNFSANPNKIIYMHFLTPTGVSQKINLTLHFLKRKQEEYERLREEIVQLQAKITQNSMHTKSISEDLYTLSTKV